MPAWRDGGAMSVCETGHCGRTKTCKKEIVADLRRPATGQLGGDGEVMELLLWAVGEVNRQFSGMANVAGRRHASFWRCRRLASEELNPECRLAVRNHTRAQRYVDSAYRGTFVRAGSLSVSGYQCLSRGRSPLHICKSNPPHRGLVCCGGFHSSPRRTEHRRSLPLES